jgi:quercetin dioxygenase-like cupin family protein
MNMLTTEGEETGMMKYRLAAALIGMMALLTTPAVAEGPKVTPLMQKDLAGLPDQEGVVLTVEYAPGASSGKHRHNAHTFVYVLEGAVVMQVEGGEAVTLGSGQTFYESPTDIHIVSKNASDSQAAKFLVVFVKDKGAPPNVPVP